MFRRELIVDFAIAFPVIISFLSIESSVGIGFIFALHAIIAGIGLLFAFCCIPEIRAMTVDEKDHAKSQML